ncbi:MAG: hypothetical protein JWP94_464, partial [Mucilaginibacter sp.]|nr:hypothetical protein [Mucilaginibacter sp.]
IYLERFYREVLKIDSLHPCALGIKHQMIKRMLMRCMQIFMVAVYISPKPADLELMLLLLRQCANIIYG